MEEPITLAKSNPLLPAEDYVSLRKQGFKHIEKAGSDHWTEYNNSDPGITILEAVSYAITDLGYRTGFEMKDLLAPEQLTPDTWKEIFYTARKILHNSPLTLNDYRKIIIDVKGVRNAWIEPSKDYEVPLWINYNHYERKDDHDCSCEDSENKGCYGKLLLDRVTPEQVTASKEEAIAKLQEAITKVNTKITELEVKIAELTVKIDAMEDGEEKDLLITERTKLEKKKVKREARRKSYEENIALIRAIPFTPSKIVEFEGLYNVMVEYEEDVIRNEERDEVRQRVIERLTGHRNLCEDFLSVQAVEYEDFGIAGSIALEEYADPDVVLAAIYFTIYRYFTPSVPFYTIGQMMEKGYTIDEIFEGPALKHGFIETVELEKTDLYRDIRLSDIISEIADIPGVKAITYLRLPFLGFDDDSSGRNYFNEWVTFLQEEKKIARIQPAMSTMMFCKQRDFITYNLGSPNDRKPECMLKMFNDHKVLERKYKLEGVERDLPVPTGEYMELEDYYPITESLPMCYGVSERAGLPADASDKRKVQALQLKGYLLFFEQLMADYLVQLNHIKDLFTFDDSVDHTYYTRPLTQIDDLQKLLIDHQGRGADHWDQILNDFTQVLENLVETPKKFLVRRNKFLNHMLARFSEDLTEYENIARWLTPYKVEQRLVADKIRILAHGEYYKISTNRGKGYNYARTDIWDTENVSGAERRVSRLLGFKCADRNTLSLDFLVVEPLLVTDSKTNTSSQKLNKSGKPLNVIKIIDPQTKEILLTSVDVIEGCCTDLLINEILTYADERKYFNFQDDLKHHTRKSAGKVGTFSFELWDNTDEEQAVVLAYSEKFNSRQDREKVYKRLQQLIDRMNDNEGLHLVEHILLRPKFDEVLDEGNASIEVKLLDVCLDECDRAKGLEETEVPNYRKKIRRIPARKCYDKMPWVLEYFRLNPASQKYDQSILFQEVSLEEGEEPIPLKFRRYESLAKRVRDLQEYGSERISYEIVSNQQEEPGDLKYSFTIHGENDTVLAQSLFVFNKRTRQQIENNESVPNDIEIEIQNLMRFFAFELDLYCEENPCDHNEDPYSFRATAILPCWPKRFRDPTFRALVEKTIQSEAPAHVHVKVIWIGTSEMQQFEKVYQQWLKEMALTEMPSYEYVNPLVEAINTLKPCGCCEDECSGE
ncbi:hypothetical protein [Ohtaekwangia koreensis]|uniref:Uncharacterized protein n=1 Tax=Ohtaekwangia koreensis TaxID=688867 RepID=A0A1T5KRE9_9BACT|nr:hypothetical protein [Ohtaekwangia koreensis]SKC66342.1 hypothetical protein SAMN05660236_2527 [Ohtaekwangia koreensis]